MSFLPVLEVMCEVFGWQDSDDSEDSDEGQDEQDGIMGEEEEEEESQFVGSESTSPQSPQVVPPVIREPTPDRLSVTRPSSAEPVSDVFVCQC